MIYFPVIIVFILTIALTTGSIVITTQLKSAYKQEQFSHLLFFLTFYFTFGFYSFWSQVLLRIFLSGHISGLTLEKITQVLAILGVPFLLFASLMSVKFFREIVSLRTGNKFSFWYIIGHLFLLSVTGFLLVKYQNTEILQVLRFYFLAVIFLIYFAGLYYSLFYSSIQKRYKDIDLRKLMVILTILMIAESGTLLFFNNHNIISLIFIFNYFLYGACIPVLIKYSADHSKFSDHTIALPGYDAFCTKFSISKREKEIISEICEGLSNQQIADKLFISLQTVKDHTHRIYSKTGCSGRTQLIKLVNEGG